MLERISAAFSGEEGGMLRAIVLGDRSSLSAKVREAFLGSGTYHILVISGLHVGFLAGLLFFFSRAIRLSLSASSLLTVGGVVFYVLLTGGSPPIVRAGLMMSLYLLALIVGRERDLANAVALAAFVLLLWNPLYLFDAGFQLTFVATGAILLALRRFDLSRLPRLPRWVLASLLASTAATLATGILLAFHFNRVSLMGVVANLVMVPLGGCLTAVGMVYSLLLLCLPQGIPLLQLGVSSLSKGMITIASIFAALPLASIRLYTPTPLMVLTGYGLLGLILFPGGRRRRLLLALTTVFLLGQVGWKLFPLERAGIEATFLDVGQGDAIFLELPGRRTMLVDGGGSLDDRFDIGERVVAPFLWHRWVRRLDVVVLSHAQPDHIRGLRAVLKNFSVGEVWESGYPSTAPSYRWLQKFVRKKGIPLRQITRGNRIPLGSEVVVTVLHPPKSFVARPKGRTSARVNNNSLVLAIDHLHFRVLLTGDIEKEGEASLVDAGVLLQADLLKVPHHGSRGSSSAFFLRRVKPRWAVVQAGDRNPFGHPHLETLNRYAAQGVEVFRTDRDGAITFSFRDGAVTRKTFRQEPRVGMDDSARFPVPVEGLTRKGGYVK
jgi:competence protein ComEC